VPYSSEIEAKVFTVDWKTRDLVSFRDMVINKYVDATGNRALSVIHADLPLVGKTQCSTFVDFTA